MEICYKKKSFIAAPIPFFPIFGFSLAKKIVFVTGAGK